MPPLPKKVCVPCTKGTPPLSKEEQDRLLLELGSSWHIEKGHHLTKTFSFENFRKALSFTNAVGAIAEKEGHHPNIHLSYGKVTLTIWTHAIDGLTESDFILAAKCDATI